MRRKNSMGWTPMLLVGGLLLTGTAFAANDYGSDTGNDQAMNDTAQSTDDSYRPAARSTGDTMSDERADRNDREEGNQILRDSIELAKQMKQDPDLAKALEQSKGVFLVPNYGRGALIVGGQGGDGVVLAHKNGTWSNPAPFNLGAVDLGAQVGVSAGAIAMILMTDDAVRQFENQNNFSLNAEAGLSIINWSKRGQASLGKGKDVIIWTDTEGLYGGATVSATDITWDDDETRGLYGREFNPKAILAGQATTQDPLVQQLKSALRG